MEVGHAQIHGQTERQAERQTDKLSCRECGTESRVRLLSCLHSYCNECIAQHTQDCKLYVYLLLFQESSSSILFYFLTGS